METLDQERARKPGDAFAFPEVPMRHFLDGSAQQSELRAGIMAELDELKRVEEVGGMVSARRPAAA
jgi:hypothetical protein